MGHMTSEFISLVAVDELIPLDLGGASQVAIMCGSGTARIMSETNTTTNNYFILPATNTAPLVLNVCDERLYILSNEAGVATRIHVWVVR